MKENKSKYTLPVKMLSILLAVIMIFSPVTAAAQTEDGQSIFENSSDILSNTQTDSEEVLYEETEKREENVKHFRMDNGTVKAVQYSSPVHFEKNGTWVDYDNTLNEVDEDKFENSGKAVKNKDLINKTSDYSVRLSKKTNGKKFVRIEKNGYKISWYYSDAKKTTAEIAETAEDDDPFTLEKATSTVIYPNVFKSTNLEYIIGSLGVKENIILNSKRAPSQFEAVYNANGLLPVQINDKTIELRTEEGEVIYTVSAPYMTDASGAYSDGISLSLTNVKNGSFTVVTSLDKEWLEAEEREYPVLADPVLKTKQSPANVESAFVSKQNPDKCYRKAGTDDMGSLYVGNISGYGQTESYVKFQLPSLSVADKVVDARFNIGLRKCELGLTVNLKRLTNDWQENTVTWNNGPYGEGRITDYKVLTESTKKDVFCEFEVTDMVRGWYSKDYPNYGLSLTTTKTSPAKAWFYSIDYTTYPENRPVLVISYRNMSGYEDYWTYSNLTAGRGGTASVNNYNGNLVYSQPVTQDAGGNLMPVNISLVYNSNRSKEVAYSLTGNHFQTNYHIFLQKESGELFNNGYKYYLNDADGTKHWFYFGSSATDGKDEDGLGYSMKVITVGSDSAEPLANYIVTDKDKNKMYFDKSYVLVRITNAAGISSTIQYETVSGVRRIKAVKDGAGRAYNFTYSADLPSRVTAIADPSGRKTQFAYSSNNLIKITFADGEAVSVSYHSAGIIHKITGIDKNRLRALYDASVQKRITSVDWGSEDANVLEKYSFVYRQNETSVTDKQNRSYTYQFNDYGQTTGVVSNIDGSAQSFKFNAGNSTSNKANKLISESRVLKSTTNYIVNPAFNKGLNGYWKYINDSNGAVVAADTTKGNITKHSLKVSKPAANAGRVNAVQSLDNMPGGTYTLSAYVNTEGATIPGEGVQIFAELHEPGNGAYISSEKIEKTTKTSGWERKSVTFTVPEGGTLRITMGLGATSSGTVWIDDVQLEKSANPSNFNIVENSDFSNDMGAWRTFSTDESTVVKASGLAGFDKCGKLTGTVENSQKILKQYLPASGKKGDVFTFGMWVNAFSAPLNSTKDNDAYKPQFRLEFNYYDKDGKYLGAQKKDFNPDIKDRWQFLSDTFVAPSDYGNLGISLVYDHNVNNAHLTGAFCYKEQYGQTYAYDSNGNVSSVVDLAKTNSTFSYYGSQMAKMLNPSGSKYLYTYNDKNQLTFAMSTDGQEYGFTYDDKGNVTKASLNARTRASKIENGKSYFIINAYSAHGINSGQTGTKGEDLRTRRYTGSTAFQWKATLVPGTTDVYTLQSVKFPEICLDVRGSSKDTGANLQIYTKNTQTKAQQFKLTKQSDGTFGIFTSVTDFAKCLDAQYDTQTIHETSRVVKQNACTKTALKEWQKWYFIPVDKADSNNILTQTEYTASKNFVSVSKNQRGLPTTYKYDEKKGTLQSVTDELNHVTSYTYNANNDSLTSVSAGGMKNSYSYSKDRLTAINVNSGTRYGFAYDVFGRTTQNKVGNGTDWKTLSSIQYNSAGLMSKQTYGNGNYYEFSYDKLDRITQKRYNGSNSKRITYAYGNSGNVAQITDYYTGTNTKFVYDLADRVVSQREYAGTGTKSETLKSSTDFTYASKTNYLTGVKHYSPLGTQSITYTYGSLANGQMPDQVYSVKWNGTEKVKYTYDAFGRLTNKKVGTFNNTYTYHNYGTARTTTLGMSVTTPAGKYAYTYDKSDKVVSYTDGTHKTTYAYDDLNQLVRENNPKTGKTYTYSYKNGNITQRNEYAYTTGELGAVTATKKWTYGDTVWKDLLTNFNGEAVTYDTIGNPTKIGSKTLTWNGRQLAKYVNGSNTTSYAYNGDGQRISKTVNGTKTDYYYNGSILAGQKTGSNTLVFMYDNNGDAFGFKYNGTEYFYVKNLQNDITAITDSAGKVIANYYYDAWGNITSTTGNTTIANTNPLRYRSYYYDTDTKLYYLNTRYYSPDMSRFLNADNLVIGTGGNVLGNNLFAYCMNCPTNMSDSSGNAPQWFKNSVKWAAKHIVKPVVKTAQKLFSSIDFTYTTGVNISGTPSVWNLNGQIGVTHDSKGNIAVQLTLGGGITTGTPSLSFTRFHSFTNAPKIKTLTMDTTQIGGSVAAMVGPAPLAVGGDAMLIYDTNEKKKYYGFTTNAGFGSPGKELHLEWGDTTTITTEFNIYKVAEEVYIKIMEW